MLKEDLFSIIPTKDGFLYKANECNFDDCEDEVIDFDDFQKRISKFFEDQQEAFNKSLER